MKWSAIHQNNKHQLEYVYIALAFCLGFLLVASSLEQSGLVVLILSLLALSFFTPIVPLSALLILSPARTLIATESGLQLPLDIGQLLLLSFVGFWFLNAIRYRIPIIKTAQSPIMWSLLLFVSLTGVTGLIAGSIMAWLTEWLKWIIIIILALYVLNNPHHKLWFAFLLVLSGVSQAIIGLYTFVGGSGADHLRITAGFFRAFGTFGQPNPFGGFMGLIAPLAIMFCLAFLLAYLRQPSRITGILTLFYGASALIITTALFASWSRGAWLGFVVSCGVMLAALPRKLWQNLTILSITICVSLLALMSNILPMTVIDRMQNAVQELVVIADVRGVYITPENYAVIERLAHWQAALNMAQDNPILGVGFGNYDNAYEKYRLLNWEMSLDHAHNYYLNVLAETGTIGLLAYLLLFFVIIFKTWQARIHPDNTSRFITIGLLGTWVYLATHSLTDNLYVNNVFIHMGIMIGLLAALIRDVSGTVKDRQDGAIDS